MDWLNITLGVLANVIAPFVAIFSVVILVHEGGHYLAARLNRLPVLQFSLGFGPRLISWHDRAGTEWVVAAIPLGGFVKVRFDDRLAARAWIIAAGPLANIVLASALLFAHALSGIHDAPPVVASIYPNTPAAVAGFQPGDRVLTVNGRAVQTFGQVTSYTALHLDERTIFDIERDGVRHSIAVTPLVATVTFDNGRTETLGLSGLIGGAAEIIRPDLPTAVRMAVFGTADLLADTLHGLYQLATGARSYDSLMGVVGIADTSAMVAQTAGLLALLTFAALISVNIAVVNALPLPVLDGGQLLMVAMEAMLKRPLPPGVHRAGNLVGLSALLALMLFTTWNDVRFLV